MNDITVTKQAFLTALEAAGLTVETSAWVPDRITPPVIILIPTSPFLEPMTLGKEWSMNMQLVLVNQTRMNELMTEELEDMIEAVITACDQLHYVRLSSVEAPYSMSTGGADFLACNINVQLAITI